MRNLIFLNFLFLCSCASEVTKSPTSFISDSSITPEIIEMLDDTKVSFSSGYNDILKANSNWKLIGNIKQGNVYKLLDGVFVVEGAHIHEANIVINHNELVGYYLPAIQSFSAAPKSITLKFFKRENNNEN